MRLKTKDMILIALFAALTAIGAFIKIPTPLVPFTLQYLFCAYSGILLGAKHGLYSQLLYLGVGLMGFPVFTQEEVPPIFFSLPSVTLSVSHYAHILSGDLRRSWIKLL